VASKVKVFVRLLHKIGYRAVPVVDVSSEANISEWKPGEDDNWLDFLDPSHPDYEEIDDIEELDNRGDLEITNAAEEDIDLSPETYDREKVYLSDIIQQEVVQNVIDESELPLLDLSWKPASGERIAIYFIQNVRDPKQKVSNYWMGVITRVSRTNANLFEVTFDDRESWFIYYDEEETETYSSEFCVGSHLWRKLDLQLFPVPK